MLQDAYDGGESRSLPNQCTIAAIIDKAAGQIEAVLLELTHHLPGNTKPAKCLKQIGQPFADLLVGIQFPAALVPTNIPNRQGKLQESFAGFVPASLIQASAQGKKFGFRESTLHA